MPYLEIRKRVPSRLSKPPLSGWRNDCPLCAVMLRSLQIAEQGRPSRLPVVTRAWYKVPWHKVLCLYHPTAVVLETMKLSPVCRNLREWTSRISLAKTQLTTPLGIDLGMTKFTYPRYRIPSMKDYAKCLIQ